MNGLWRVGRAYVNIPSLPHAMDHCGKTDGVIMLAEIVCIKIVYVQQDGE